MHVFGKNRTRPDRDTGLGNVFGKSPPDRPCLNAIELHGWPRESFLPGASKFAIMRLVSHGAPFVGLGGFTGREEQFPRANELGPRPARIVGKPEAIRAKDNVVAENHIPPVTD